LKKITCKGTLRQVFSRIYTMESVSQSLWTGGHIGIFDPATRTVAPHPFSLVQLPPAPPFHVSISILSTYTYSVCKMGVWGSGPQADRHLPQSPFTGNFF
jgi:hypothetical protein